MHLHSQHRCFLPYCSLITLTIAMVIVWLLLLYLLILFHHELLLLLLLSVTVVRSIVCRLSSTLIALGLVLLASFLTIVLTLWRFVVWLTSCVLLLCWLLVGLCVSLWWTSCHGSSLNLFILVIQWRLIFLWWVLKVRCGWHLAVGVIDFDPLCASSEVAVCCLV